MPPNTANDNSTDVTVRNKKGQQSSNNQSNKTDQSRSTKDSKTNAQLTKSKGLNNEIKISIGIAVIAFIIVILSPAILKQLAQLKRSFFKVPIDTKPIETSTVVDPDTGVEYEYHQFMATVEQHFSNVR